MNIAAAQLYDSLDCKDKTLDNTRSSSSFSEGEKTTPEADDLQLNGTRKINASTEISADSSIERLVTNRPSADLIGASLSAQGQEGSTSDSSEPQTDISLEIAFDILLEKGIKKAVEYLTACNILTPSARDIASFLRLHQKRIEPSVLGDYLGEENRCGGEQWNLIRFHFVRVISFVGMNVEEA